MRLNQRMVMDGRRKGVYTSKRRVKSRKRERKGGRNELTEKSSNNKVVSESKL